MANKTIRELGADGAPADTFLVAVQAGTGSSEPVKTTLAQLRARMQVGLHAVASSGAYVDLSGKPTLGALADNDTVATADLNDGAVTLVKIVQASGQYKLLGRSSAAAGVWQEIASSSDVFGLLTAASNAAIRAAIGLGTIATQNAGAVALTGGAIDNVAVRRATTAKTASFTFALTDGSAVMQCSHATVPIVGTIPTDATIGGSGWPTGSLLFIEQHDVAAASFAAAVGVTINKPSDRTLVCRTQHSPIGVRNTGVNEWLAFGALGT